MEQVVSQVAAHLDLAPEDVRLKNMYQEGDLTPYDMPLDTCAISRCWQELQESCSFQNRKNVVEEFNK